MITPKILESFPIYQATDYRTADRGRQYYHEGRVFNIEYYETSAVCKVKGQNSNYQVTISLNAKNKLQFECTCPQAKVTKICKHMIASLLALNTYLKSEEMQNDWQFKLGQALVNEPRHRKKDNIKRYAAILLLRKNTYYHGAVFSLHPRIVKASQWPALRIMNTDYAAANQFLNKNRGWDFHLETPYRASNPNGCLNLSPEGISFFNYIVTNGSYSGISNFFDYVPMLARMAAPIFITDERGRVKEMIRVLTEPVEVQAALVRDGDQLTLQMGIDLEGHISSSAKERVEIISQDPPWILIGDAIAPLANPESIEILQLLPLEIPAAHEDIFREKYFHRIARRLPIHGTEVTWEEIHENAIPRLYLHNDDGVLRADLRFGYGAHEALADRDPPPVFIAEIPGSWTLTRIHRQPAQEAEYYQMLTIAKYGLKRASGNFPYGTFEMRASIHPFDFLTRSIPTLTQAGFEIYGDRDSLGKINPHRPTIRLNITSGIDWFELDAIVQFGDQEVDLRELRKAIRKGDQYVKLADGSIGQIPEVWLERYKHLFNLAEETQSGLSVGQLQLSLVDELLEDSEVQNLPADFIQKRERLKSLTGIRAHSIPQGFTGELRPYQRAGLDWLHFLREYGFGGILADDMGLGKTIQVLALLQSIRETNQFEAPVLLVVPKSLLTNWQRESARFTPSLRCLEYIGNFRNKDTNSFGDYDIILTTYGTMLRDIDILRGYRFSYAILDESQAIKNPLAQTSKAARLLNAERRLVMTGTPVENNTFELWSQFAFVNPGLLGNLDHFKHEFANPIENRKDETTAALLKRMIYPFVLRRTKEQVAPELPPRTERIIYTDMEPAQRKLYIHTRDYYRAQLLGMIDDGGMNNARMKILEGLLRLRQICIHPALVEPTYKKESAKFEILLETMETLHAEGHKALVFSQFVQTLKLLKIEMNNAGLPYTYLDGKTKDRQIVVDAFQDDPSISFFLISLKAGGVGLNLTAADYVLHLDPWWNPAVEMQASDRAHRIGQDKPVFVFKYIIRETVEEKILELQARKKDLVEQLISAEGSFFKSLTKDDIKVLFS